MTPRLPLNPVASNRFTELAAKAIIGAVLFVAAMWSGALALSPASAATFYYNDSGIAIQGFDVVSFHTERKSKTGKPEFYVDWKGARWRFSTPENRDLFAANPTQYAPQYGGWCAYAMARGYQATTDVRNAWTLHQGKLYLNYSVGIKASWEQEKKASIPRADGNWPRLSQQILAGS